MKDNLGHHASQEVLNQRVREPEIGPIVPLLQNLQAVTLEIDITSKVFLMESLHGNRLLAIVLVLIFLLVESEIVLDGLAREFGLLVFPGGKSRRDNPKSGQDRNINNQGEEDASLPSTSNFPSHVNGHSDEEGEEGGIGEGLATRTVGGKGSIFDRRILQRMSVSIQLILISCQWLLVVSPGSSNKQNGAYRSGPHAAILDRSRRTGSGRSFYPLEVLFRRSAGHVGYMGWEEEERL